MLYWNDALGRWDLVLESPFPMLMTTAVAYNIVVEPASDLNGINLTEEGEPWEFLAGLNHPEYTPVPYGHPQWNAYVTYTCAWSVLNVTTPLGNLDMIYEAVEKLVRENCVIADIGCDEKVTITDIVIAALAFGSRPGDPNWDPRADIADSREWITIRDIVRIAIDFGEKLTPNGIVLS